MSKMFLAKLTLSLLNSTWEYFSMEDLRYLKNKQMSEKLEHYFIVFFKQNKQQPKVYLSFTQ